MPVTEPPEEQTSGLRFAAAIGCAVVVLVAVGLEFASGQAANSPVDARFGLWVPLGWPQPVRVVWWLLVAAAAAAHRLLLDERCGWRRRLLAIVAATPFAVFAIGIAFGTSWSTWH